MNAAITWLLENKQWLFSGCGVTVISAVIGLIAWLMRRKRNIPAPLLESVATLPQPGVSQTPPIAAAPEPEQPRAPHVIILKETEPPQSVLPRATCKIPLREVVDDVEAQPLYRKERVREEYAGRRVYFSGFLVNLYEERSGALYVLASSEDHCCSAEFRVLIERYPEFKIMKRDDPLTVEGTIKGFGYGGSTAELDDVIVNFLTPSEKVARSLLNGTYGNPDNERRHPGLSGAE